MIKLMTDKQRELIDAMNEFCTEKLIYDDRTTCAEARNYISRNMDQFKLLTMSNWQLNYL